MKLISTHTKNIYQTFTKSNAHIVLHLPFIICLKTIIICFKDANQLFKFFYRKKNLFCFLKKEATRNYELNSAIFQFRF
jgi:hypothetical protein